MTSLRWVEGFFSFHRSYDGSTQRLNDAWCGGFRSGYGDLQDSKNAKNLERCAYGPRYGRYGELTKSQAASRVMMMLGAQKSVGRWGVGVIGVAWRHLLRCSMSMNDNV